MKFNNTQELINEDCDRCRLKDCPEKCFNNHIGSYIALRKCANHCTKNTLSKKSILIIDENGAEV